MRTRIKIQFQHKCCEHCSNNPANNPNANGICFCTAPAMERAGQTGAPKSYTTTTTATPNIYRRKK